MSNDKLNVLASVAALCAAVREKWLGLIKASVGLGTQVADLAKALISQALTEGDEDNEGAVARLVFGQLEYLATKDRQYSREYVRGILNDAQSQLGYDASFRPMTPEAIAERKAKQEAAKTKRDEVSEQAYALAARVCGIVSGSGVVASEQTKLLRDVSKLLTQLAGGKITVAQINAKCPAQDTGKPGKPGKVVVMPSAPARDNGHAVKQAA